MHGFEYAAASHMVQEGMVDEAVEMVTALRARYDGRYRNPFNEIECGNNYARSMAAFSLLPGFLGLTADMGRGILRFAPKVEGAFRCPLSVGTGWGEYERHGDGSVTLTALGGQWRLREIQMEMPATSVAHPAGAPVATLDGRPVACARTAEGFRFEGLVALKAGSVLRIG